MYNLCIVKQYSAQNTGFMRDTFQYIHYIIHGFIIIITYSLYSLYY